MLGPIKKKKKRKTNNKKKSKKIESSSVKSVPIIVHRNVFNVGITLIESNYDLWSQIMEINIVEQEKLSYIRGKKETPADSDDGYQKWYVENQKVNRWLLMSMSPEIMMCYLSLPTSRDI